MEMSEQLQTDNLVDSVAIMSLDKNQKQQQHHGGGGRNGKGKGRNKQQNLATPAAADGQQSTANPPIPNDPTDSVANNITVEEAMKNVN